MNHTDSGAAAKLPLDHDSLPIDELSIPALTREISLQRRPNWLLVKMMNALEQKRQSKGFGWSRAWNKYGATTFRTHITHLEEDQDYLRPIPDFLRALLGDSAGEYQSFIDELLDDPKRMVFTFYHNMEDEGIQSEGLTLSLGRKVSQDKTKRDRLDIILEDRRENGAVDRRVDRVRIYVCPWNTYQDKQFHLTDIRNLDVPQQQAAQTLYEHAIAYYHQWKGDEDRQWSHWSARYIDYFGPRSFIPLGSSFT
ncbi:MAG: hypothetical protein IIB38_03985 [Candidatus Hydrogenedentes bacterium]|nr:hypothetical protein [Candidatus Hydrogenedentota bacterium]